MARALGSAPQEPTPELVLLVEERLGKRGLRWRKHHTGLSPAQRFVVRFEDGSSVFVKAAVDEQTERELRTDHLMMSTLDADFVPEIVAWIDADPHSILIIEDLRDAHWPADHFRVEGGRRQPVLWKPGPGMEWIEEAFGDFEATLLGFDARVRADGGRFVAVLFPLRFQVSSRDWRLLARRHALDPDRFDLERPNARILAFCHERGIECIDSTGALREAQAAGRGPLFRGRGDMHLSDAGQAVDAGFLASALGAKSQI